MTATAPSDIGQAEAPSGKGAADENFPVGSFLLPKALRPKVAVFYAFARAIDDVADDPDLPPEEKRTRLGGFDAALTGATDDPAYIKAIRVREEMGEIGNIIQHSRDLIVAFKADTHKLRYRDWDDLMGYCNNSASPVGRVLLDLHGCPPGGYPYSDALCNALQVINHLQDCGDDRRTLDRVYIPQEWLAEFGGATEDLDKPAATPALRKAMDRCLDETEALLAIARTLPRALTSRRLAMESSAIIRLAESLCKRLRRQDPLAVRVELSKPMAAWIAFLGVARYWLGR